MSGQVTSSRIAASSAAVAILVALAALGGWWLDSPWLAKGLPHAQPVGPIPALALLALGGALLFAVGAAGGTALPDASWRVRQWSCRILAGIAALLGIALVIPDWPTRPAWNPMPGTPQVASWLAAITIVALGFAIAIAPSATVRCRRLAVKLALGASVLPWITIVGYISAIPFSTPFAGAHTGMAMLTAIVTLVLAIGVVELWPTHGFAALIASPSSGGLLLRGLLPAALVVPITIDRMLYYGESQHWFGREFRVALDLGVTSLIFAGLVMWIGMLLKRRDVEQRALITICAWSKRVLDEGKWVQFEEFLERRLKISVTHSISAESADQVLSELLEDWPADPKETSDASR